MVVSAVPLMSGNSFNEQKAQLDKKEREHLEDVVTEMRERVEDNVTFQLTQQGLDGEPTDRDALSGEIQQIAEAIELEAVDDDSWSEAVDQYVTGVGYTIVNRLAALRCMEVRDFIGEEVTVFKENGLTPAAETLVHEEFLLEDEALLEAYYNACDNLAEEIEILFDRSSAYSLIDPDDDTFKELCGMLDEVPEEVWRADDVLGWVYEYYNSTQLTELREKARTIGLDPEDIAAANQFYTPHWVVRLLTDNSLGKLYLEAQGNLDQVVDQQQDLTASERRQRSTSIEESPNISDLCTYMVPAAEGSAPKFESPDELRIIDPACGSGHFLLYAFDILERIWRVERPDLDPAEIPQKILKHNLHGVDLDLRACQLTTFNLYLKARSRAEAEGMNCFDMPPVNIVCADTKVVKFGAIEDIFDEVANDRPDVRSSLQSILDAFEDVQGLGSLLDVRGTLADHFDEDTQLKLTDTFEDSHSLSDFLHSLRKEIEKHQDNESFLAKDLRSFVQLIDILTGEYHVSLMNPPYGNRQRMPEEFKEYIDSHYQHYADFYVTFFEVCSQLTIKDGRIGMLVPWTILFKRSFESVRENFVGDEGAVDFLAEFRYGILDNATVGTIGTVVRNGTNQHTEGTFIRLHDIEKGEKESTFTDVITREIESDVQRWFNVPMTEFSNVPATPINYSIPAEVRRLHQSNLKLGPDAADIEGEKVANIKTGLQTGNNSRFVRNHWEIVNNEFHPYAKGGEQSWITPLMKKVVNWRNDGSILERASGSLLRNREYYDSAGLTWTYIKRTGRRFGHISGAKFDVAGSMIFPHRDISPWLMMGVLNSTPYHGLFLSLTPERHWQIEIVGRMPWQTNLESYNQIEELTKEQFELIIEGQNKNPLSPYYISPALLPDESRSDPFYEHPYSEKIESDESSNWEIDVTQSISEAAKNAERTDRNRRQNIELLSDEIDEIVAKALNLSEETMAELKTEIFLRTAESPEDREIAPPQSVTDESIDLEENVRNLIHHVAMEVVRESEDAIIPLKSTDDQMDMLDEIVSRFQEIYGASSGSRLIEIDNVLGSKSAEEEEYPNIRDFIANDLFDYHVSKMKNTPIIWKVTTSRLVSDSTSDGFACFINYHKLDQGVFDRLITQYVGPYKSELRERRSAADRRRKNNSLTTSEQAEAAETYDRYTNHLEQISVFEDVLQDLTTPVERDLGSRERDLAKSLASKIQSFRYSTEKRLEALDDLHEIKSEDWFEDTFSPNFWAKVEDLREEWVGALEDLEEACKEYAKPTDEPVEAHLGDLFNYFNDRLKGSDHYSSSGILFMTYYFEREGTSLLNENGKPRNGLNEDYAEKLAILAGGLDTYKALAEEIANDCDAFSKQIPSDWKDRALSEITTTGYDPSQKHGVEINLIPLASADIVPKTVDDKVL